MTQLLDSVLMRLLMLMASIILFFTPNALEKAELCVANEVTTQTAELHIEMKNGFGTEILTGETILLEKRENDEWVTVEQNGRYPGFPEIGIILYPLQTHSQTVNIINVYGDYLSEGEYRVTKEYDKVGVADIQTCSAIFSVRSAE